MQDRLPVVTGIKELENGYSCRVNGGNIESTFTAGMSGRAGRVYQSIMLAIDNGEPVEPYVEPVKTPEDEVLEVERAIVELAKSSLVDIIDEYAKSGKDVKKAVKDLIRARQDLLDALA